MSKKTITKSSAILCQEIGIDIVYSEIAAIMYKKSDTMNKIKIESLLNKQIFINPLIDKDAHRHKNLMLELKKIENDQFHLGQ